MIFSKLKKIFYPTDFSCIVCGCRGFVREEHSGAVLCDACERTFDKITEPCCIKCGRQVKSENSYCRMCAKYDFEFEKAASVYNYKGTVKEAVHKLKYAEEAWLCEFAAKEMAKKYEQLNWKCDYVTFVPMYSAKQTMRGYNQAEVLARAFAENVGLKCIEALKRTKYTVPQSYLSKEERMTNVENAIALDERYESVVKDKTVLVIDDIMTTGSSVNECAKILKKSGSTCVYGLCMCSVEE